MVVYVKKYYDLICLRALYGRVSGYFRQLYPQKTKKPTVEDKKQFFVLQRFFPFLSFFMQIFFPNITF